MSHSTDRYISERSIPKSTTFEPSISHICRKSTCRNNKKYTYRFYFGLFFQNIVEKEKRKEMHAPKKKLIYEERRFWSLGSKEFVLQVWNSIPTMAL